MVRQCKRLPAKTRGITHDIKWNCGDFREFRLIIKEETDETYADDERGENLDRLPRVMNTTPCEARHRKSGTDDDNEVATTYED